MDYVQRALCDLRNLKLGQSTMTRSSFLSKPPVNPTTWVKEEEEIISLEFSPTERPCRQSFCFCFRPRKSFKIPIEKAKMLIRRLPLLDFSSFPEMIHLLFLMFYFPSSSSSLSVCRVDIHEEKEETLKNLISISCEATTS